MQHNGKVELVIKILPLISRARTLQTTLLLALRGWCLDEFCFQKGTRRRLEGSKRKMGCAPFYSASCSCHHSPRKQCIFTPAVAVHSSGSSYLHLQFYSFPEQASSWFLRDSSWPGFTPRSPCLAPWLLLQNSRL